MTDENKATSLLSHVAAQIAEKGNDEVYLNLVSELVDREINKRSDALVKAFDLLEKRKKEMYRLKPDQSLYNEDGELISLGFSKAILDQRKKLVEQINKLERAINKGLNGDCGDVYGLVNNSGGGDSSKETTS